MAEEVEDINEKIPTCSRRHHATESGKSGSCPVEVHHCVSKIYHTSILRFEILCLWLGFLELERSQPPGSNS